MMLDLGAQTADTTVTLRFWPVEEIDPGALEALTRLTWRPFEAQGLIGGRLVFRGRGQPPDEASRMMYDILLELVMLSGATIMADCQTEGGQGSERNGQP
jgi:hypothetical protein